jgi:hypothetical protein
MKTGNDVVDTIVISIMDSIGNTGYQIPPNQNHSNKIAKLFDNLPLQVKQIIWDHEKNEKLQYDAKLAKRYGGRTEDVQDHRFISKMSANDKKFLGVYDLFFGTVLLHPSYPYPERLNPLMRMTVMSSFNPYRVL